MNNRRHLLLLLGFVAIVPIDAISQEMSPALKQAPLFESLHTENRQWTMNHICVLDDIKASRHYTNRDFADAILEFIKFRWDSALSQSEKTFFLLGYTTHTLIDLHWPGRIERSANGQIVRFKTCAELGGPTGIQNEESNPSSSVREDAAWKQKAHEAVVKLLRTYKEGRPFSEISEYLRGGALMIEPGREAMLLGE
jgi:hypothetical protein